MNIFNFINEINKKIDELDKKATNPFIDRENEYDPFKNIFNRTYVWIEEEKEDKDSFIQ